MKKRLLVCLALLLLLAVVSAALRWMWWKRQTEPRDIPVLMYHNVLPKGDLSVWQVSVDEFARQMDQLAAAGYTTILPDDIARASRGWGRLPPKPIVITFDDGYEGVMTHAEPILARHGFKAICYVIVSRLAGEGDDRGVFDSGPLLSTNEAAAMASRGVVAVGSHSMTHGKGTPQQRASEIGPSRKELRRRMGVDTRSYCYPFGLCGYDFMDAALRENGFTTAMACKDEMFHYGTDTNLFAIPRISVYGGNHELAFQGIDADGGKVVFSNHGARLPLCVVVRNDATGQEWKSELQNVGGDRPIIFEFPSEALDGPRTIEAWDKFGIFRYYP